MKLSDLHIIEKLNKGKLRIEPRPPDSAITGISVDLRLSNSFRVFDNHNLSFIDLTIPSSKIKHAIDSVMSDEIIIASKQKFFLHPGKLALANTKEHIELPDNLVGWLDGRSSLARLGLMVHVTAHRIDPGWAGQIVLEIYNSGPLPIALAENMVICAINFEKMTSSALTPYNKKSNAKYLNQKGAVSSKMNSD